jgi:hypothetical protein
MTTPKNLEECVQVLKQALSSKDLEDLKQGKLKPTDLHFNLGMSMRNGWGLWKGSGLSKWFNKQGIHHPDDMSSIILDCLVASVQDKPFDLSKEVLFYQKYWEEMEKRKGSSFCVSIENGKVKIGDIPSK